MQPIPLYRKVCYKPHLSRGWSPWLLYSPLTDYAAHYYDATCVREGPALDPKGHYMFAVYPHGIYGVCRLFTGGADVGGGHRDATEPTRWV